MSLTHQELRQVAREAYRAKPYSHQTLQQAFVLLVEKNVSIASVDIAKLSNEIRRCKQDGRED